MLPTLSLGSRGAAVLSLQRRLVSLHYYVGSVDGYFGSNTMHAVVAFQKVSVMSRTGRVTSVVWARLARPLIPRLRYIRSGKGLEVDLRKQVMYRTSGGAIVSIYDTSTGRPSLPTPVSNARALHIWKRTLWGSTGYNDSEHYVHYFYPHSLLAIHAYSYVPTYPASHGCIRLTPSEAANLWSVSFVGEALYTYY